MPDQSNPIVLDKPVVFDPEGEIPDNAVQRGHDLTEGEVPPVSDESPADRREAHGSDFGDA